jgi:rod shape-determining protein MreD
MSRGTLMGTPAVPELSFRSVILYGLLLSVGLGLQAGLSWRLSFIGGQPDFLLALALCGALLTDAPTGAAAGFVSGLMTAAITGQTMGTYLVTRTVAAALVGWLRKRFVRAGVLITLLGVGAGSIVASVLYGLSNPRIGMGNWLSLTFVGALFNILVALPVAILLRGQTRH